MGITFYSNIYSAKKLHNSGFRFRVLTPSYRNKNIVVTRNPKKMTKIVMVFYSDVKKEQLEDIKSLKQKHIIGFDLCDNYTVKEREVFKHMLEIADFVTCSTSFLKKQLDEYFNYLKPIYVIEDPVWYNISEPSFEPKDALEILLIENDPLREEAVEKRINEINNHFKVNITLMSRRHLNVSFNHTLVDFDIKKQELYTKNADFVMLPSNPSDKWLNSKSPNRVMDSMACGTMVIADKIDSYLPFSPFAEITDDFVKSVEHCLENRKLTLERIKNGQIFIEKNFSKKIIRNKWNDLSFTLNKNIRWY